MRPEIFENHLTIDDRMEEGMSEEEAVASIGSLDDVMSQIDDELTATRIIEKERKVLKRPGPGMIVLLIL